MAFVAAAAEIGGAEAAGAEAGEGEAFMADSSASGQAIFEKAQQIIGDALAVASSIFQLVVKVRKRDEQDMDLKRKRYLLGILFPDEDRDQLVESGQIANYWASSNLRRLINRGILPRTWTPEAATFQGFGEEVRNRQLAFRKMINFDNALVRERVNQARIQADEDLRQQRITEDETNRQLAVQQNLLTLAV